MRSSSPISQALRFRMSRSRRVCGLAWVACRMLIERVTQNEVRIMATRAEGQVLTNHDEIRRWAEARKAQPACVKGTENESGSCLLRLDFPGYSGEDSLEAIEWEQWFDVFDKRKLALIV